MSKRGARLGQHFLMHRAIASRIAEVSRVGVRDTVLEVGPGTGILTRELLSRARRVIAVEADALLCEKLKETFAPEIRAKKLVLVAGDIRAFDLASIPAPYHVVANIPYYITGEILRQFLSSSQKPRSMTLLVQKEVAERVARATKESVLSLSIKAYGTPRYEFTVAKGAFVPAPSVDSAVLSISSIRTRAFKTKREETRFFELVKAGFAHKRKRLMSNLVLCAPENRVAGAFETLELQKNVRAEDVSLPLWRALSALL